MCVIIIILTAVQRESSWLLADIDPCGRLCPHHDIFWGSPALNRSSMVGAVQAVAMQQFIAGSIQVGQSGEQQSGGGSGLKSWRFSCSVLVGELSLSLIIYKASCGVTAAAGWSAAPICQRGTGCKHTDNTLNWDIYTNQTWLNSSVTHYRRMKPKMSLTWALLSSGWRDSSWGHK